ncbi:MAG: hypothetical protein D3923_00835 [Candidatus Electrothrix sp. AR3]|nr:hypothetical protein [Candidatus Electrothrix sp. AR3]
MTSPGSIVEYLDSGRFLCGLVLQTNNNRLRLLNQNGRELNLPASRVVTVSKTKHQTASNREDHIALLKGMAEKRAALAESIPLKEIWELASEEEQASFPADFLAELSFGGNLNDDQSAAFLRAVFEDRLFFKYKNEVVTVHSQEQVEQLRHQQQKEKEREELLTTGAANLQMIMEGKQITVTEWPDQERIFSLIVDYALFGNEAESSDLVKLLLKKAQLYRDNDAHKLLIQAGVWKRDENIPLLQAEQPVEFEEELLCLK